MFEASENEIHTVNEIRSNNHSDMSKFKEMIEIIRIYVPLLPFSILQKYKIRCEHVTQHQSIDKGRQYKTILFA